MTPYEKRKEQDKIRHRKRTQKRKESGHCLRCGCFLEGISSNTSCNTCLRKRQQDRVKWRNLTFQILGDRCVDCGTIDRRVFTIDHPEGDGKYHRKGKHVNWKHYYLAAQSGDIFLEIRCYNCHAIKDLRREL